MKVLVSFKMIPDLDLLPAADFVADGQLQVETGFVPTTLNCYDESALEMARQLAENGGEEVDLTAFTLGSEAAEITLKTLYALGYTGGVRVEPCNDIRFAPERVAAAVAAYLEREKQDIVLAGTQSPEGDNGQMPLLLAEKLGWPCVTQVTSLKIQEDGTLEVESLTEEGHLIQRLRPPVVLAVGDCPSSYLKVPTLKDRMQKGRRPVKVLTMEGLVPENLPSARLLALRPVNHARQGRVIEGETAQQKAQILYESYIKGILEEL